MESNKAMGCGFFNTIKQVACHNALHSPKTFDITLTKLVRKLL